MADVSRNRGQLFLVGALALAVMLVVLALVLNTAIYTENLATRGAGVRDADDALAFQQSVRQTVGDIVVAANQDNTAYPDQTTAVDDAVADVGPMLRKYQIRDGAFVSVSNPSSVPGARISQSTAADFTGPANAADWTVANDVQTRQFKLTADRGALAATSTDAFAVVFDDGSNVWRVEIYQDDPTTPTKTFVTVDGPSGTATCTDTDPETTVDFSAGTVNDAPCPAIQFFSRLADPYQVRFENGDNGDGTYGLVVSKSAGSLTAGYGPATSPTATPAIYATNVDVVYRTADVTYEATLRVAPGEHDG